MSANDFFEKIDSLVSHIDNMDDVINTLIALERKFDIKCAVVTRDDVNEEFSQCHEFDGDGAREMTDADWDKFASEWFWRKGHSEIMWDGVSDAIRWDLREAGIIPKTSVV